MKIKYSSTVLNPDGETPKKPKLVLRRICQTEFAISSDNAKMFDRGNARYAFAFELERSHASAEAAFAFAMRHPQNLAAKSPADLVFECEPPDTGACTGFKMNAAVLCRAETSADGIVSNSRYEFEASTFGEI